MESPAESVGTNPSDVEPSPLRTRFIRSHNRFVLCWPDDSSLVIENHRTVRAVAWALCIVGWPVVLLGVLGVIAQMMKPQGAGFVVAGLLLLWGGALALMGVWLLGPRYRFDASSGCLTVRHFWRKRRRPLADVAAVQLIDAGEFGTKFHQSYDSSPAVRFSSFQLNLVLDDAAEPRWFVAYNFDFTDIARKAKILADFLGVPLLASPQALELVQTFGAHDAQSSAGIAGARRFRGSDALRSIPDRRLPEPFCSWIDEARPLPAQVRLLPRNVPVLQHLGQFILLGVMMIGMDGLIVALFLPVLVAAGAWIPIVVVASFCVLLALIPLYLLRRLFITLGAWRRRNRGTLRQGILVGPQGVLVRLEPNRCYAISLDRYGSAKIEKSPTPGHVPADFVVETLDGRTAFYQDWLSAPPEELNQLVAELRSNSA